MRLPAVMLIPGPKAKARAKAKRCCCPSFTPFGVKSMKKNGEAGTNTNVE